MPKDGARSTVRFCTLRAYFYNILVSVSDLAWLSESTEAASTTPEREQRESVLPNPDVVRRPGS